MSSVNLLATTKSEYDIGRASPAPSKVVGYDRYLAQGPVNQSDIEMTRLNVDQVPLLTAPQVTGIFDPMANRSNLSVETYSPYSAPANGELSPQIPAYTAPMLDYREASLLRPQASGAAELNHYPPSPHDTNMAGRGAYRGY